MTFEVAKGSSSKVAPDTGEYENPMHSEESDPENTESEERRGRELELKEKRELERARRIAAFKRKRGCINFLRKVVCFRDDEKKFDIETKIPTCKQVCCWRLLRARRLSHRFHTSEDSLQAFEKSKYQNFISILISVNYIILYAVLLYPFILILQAKIADRNENEELE